MTIKVQLEREDEDIAPDVIAPFFPLVCIIVNVGTCVVLSPCGTKFNRKKINKFEMF